MASRTSRTRDPVVEMVLSRCHWSARIWTSAPEHRGEVDESVERDPADEFVPIGHLWFDFGQDIGHGAPCGGAGASAPGKKENQPSGDEGQIEDGLGQGGGVPGQEAR